MFTSTFNFIFTSTNKLVSNVLIVVNALQKYNDGKLSVRIHNMSYLLRHIGVNCSSIQTEVVTEDLLLLQENTLRETKPLWRRDMYSDTTIEEHHHIKVFCYMIFVHNGRHFEFVNNFRSNMRFHSVSLF